MRRWIHPSRARLTAWLETGGPDKVDQHVENCDRCAAKLEAIETPGPTLAFALREVLEPPANLAERMNLHVEAALRRREEFMLLAGLLGIPFETARIVMMPNTNESTESQKDTDQ
jgi:hypothetical protein